MYQKCINTKGDSQDNYLKGTLPDLSSYEEVSAPKSPQIIASRYAPDIEVEVIYQTVENLIKAIPNHLGDWYFTGNYPTPRR